MRPKSIWRGSMNMNHKEPGRTISCIILHATANVDTEDSIERLCKKGSKRSTHYLISPEGILYSLVEEKNVAWHAGNSQWKGEMLVNKFSIGIELVGTNADDAVYPLDQLLTCADLCAAICREYKIAIGNVIGHVDVSPKLRTDPANFPWEQFKGMLLDRGLGV